jgi:hypothetical protein
MDDIAVVGLSCRFPGDATSEDNLWNEVLAKGKSTWSTFPPSRFNAAGFYHPDSSRQGVVSYHSLSPQLLPKLSVTDLLQAIRQGRPFPQEWR